MSIECRGRLCCLADSATVWRIAYSYGEYLLKIVLFAGDTPDYYRGGGDKNVINTWEWYIWRYFINLQGNCLNVIDVKSMLCSMAYHDRLCESAFKANDF